MFGLINVLDQNNRIKKPLTSPDITSLSEESCPQLHPHNPKDEEDKEAEQQHVAQHWQGVQQQHHQDSGNRVHQIFAETMNPFSNLMLGILLIAFRGLRTRTVLIADRFSFSTSIRYSSALLKTFLFQYCVDVDRLDRFTQKPQ